MCIIPNNDRFFMVLVNCNNPVMVILSGLEWTDSVKESHVFHLMIMKNEFER